jgi:hypothetical protein
MPELAINYHDSIGPIKLGAERLEFRRILEEQGFHFERARRSMDFFCEASIQVEYHEDGTASFIGISFHSSHKCTYQGMNVFDTPAEEIFSLMAAGEGDGSIHTFDHCEYVFPKQILTLYEADSQYDRLGGEVRPIWAQVGIGDARYWEAVKKYQ